MDYSRRIESYNFSGGNHEDEDSNNDDSNKKHRVASLAASCSSSASPSGAVLEKEHMFDKVVTPSDVGKLNRLVIPKQHAEKYFPLDTAAHEKGLLLSFEDRGGKPWRFRYSYWNSSQSYVMTKGWSRFVKEKRLDAGDTVSFGRGVDDKDRLFIDWRRRPEAHQPPRQLPRVPLPPNYHHHHHPMVSFARSVGPWAAGRTLLLPPNQNYMYNAAAGGSGGGGQYLVFRSAGVAGPPQAPVVLDSVPVQSQQGGAKRVRLFGVNLDSPPPDSPSSSSPSPKGKDKLSLDLDM